MSNRPAASARPAPRTPRPSSGKADVGLVATVLVSAAITAGTWFALQPDRPALELPRVVVDVPPTAASTAGGVQTVLDGDAMHELGRELEGVKRRVTEIAVVADGTTDGDSAFRATFARDMRDATEHFLVAADLLRADAMVRNATFNPHDVRLSDATIELLRATTRLHQERIRLVRESRARAQARAVEELARSDGLHRLADARAHVGADDMRRLEARAQKLAQRFSQPLERVRLALEADLVADALDADATFYHAGEAYFAPRGSVNPRLSEFDECREFLAIEMFGDVLGVFTHVGALSHEEAVQAYERLMARAGNGASGN